MIQSVGLIIYPVKDILQAKTAYAKFLGVAPYADTPYYVGYKIGDQEIGLDPHGHNQGMTGPIAYWYVDDIKKSLQSMLEAGAQTQQDIRDVGGGKLIARVKDADGNVTGLVQMP